MITNIDGMQRPMQAVTANPIPLPGFQKITNFVQNKALKNAPKKQ